MSDQDKLIETLFLSYHDALKKACMSYFHYQPQYMPYVDDCIQEVFVAAFRKKNDLARHPNPYAWLANACKKQCASLIRKKTVRESIVGKRIPFDDQMADTCLQDDIVRWLDAFDAEQHLVNLRSQLNESENKIYAEYFLQRKNASQIASEQHMTETAVYGTIQRIRKKACRLLCLAIFFSIGSLILVCHAVIM